MAASGPLSREGTFSAVSLNVAKTRDPDRIVQAIRSAPRLYEADLFMFQEVAHGEEKPSVAEEAAHSLGYSTAFAPAGEGIYDQGLALVSRYPLTDVRVTALRECNLRFRSRKRFALSATVQTPSGDLRVWNIHLDTRINSRERLTQLQPALDDAATHDGPRLIGGDFNTNDLYWLGNVVPLPFGPTHGIALRRAMALHGFETPLPERLDTFPPFRRHLDWIFQSGLKSLAASAEPAPFSDHNAIWLRVGLE
ncbi:MAG: endonuclease/exonuclease/phosphatase family protein [Acidobacteriota bacterium]